MRSGHLVAGVCLVAASACGGSAASPTIGGADSPEGSDTDSGAAVLEISTDALRQFGLGEPTGNREEIVQVSDGVVFPTAMPDLYQMAIVSSGEQTRNWSTWAFCRVRPLPSINDVPSRRLHRPRHRRRRLHATQQRTL